MKLKGKVLWITGASSGIGEALTYALAKKGCKLIISARRKEELERVKSSCPEFAQAGIAVLPLDLAAAAIQLARADERQRPIAHIAEIRVSDPPRARRGSHGSPHLSSP